MKPATRAGLAVAVTVFLVAVGTGVSYALWATNASTSADVKTGKVLLTADGAAATLLSSEYRPGEPVTAPITITNGGSVALDYTVAVASTDALATGITIDIWEVATASDCTAASTVSGRVWSGTLAGISVAPTGSIDATENQVLCVRTALAASVATAQQGQTATATLTFTGTNGWLSSATVGVKPSVLVVPNPALLATGGCLGDNGESHKNVYLAWHDVPGATSYRLYFTPAVSPAPVPPAVPYVSVTVSKATITGANFDTAKGSAAESGSVSIRSVVNGWESVGLVVPIYFVKDSQGNNEKISCTAFPVK